LNNPGHEDFYGKRNDRMPAFGEKKILSSEEIGLIADWLRGDWYEPVESQARE
jgi:mono/diheme cytochrome c family protein